MLLHPLGADRRVWRPVIPHLTARREVLSIDLPGFGASPPLREGRPATPAHLAVAVVRLLVGLGLDAGETHLAGNSLGGWVALEMAAAGHAASVTAIAPAGLWPRPLGPKPQLGRALARALHPLARPAMAAPPLRRLALAGSVARPEQVPAKDAAALLEAYATAEGFADVNRAMRAGTFTRLAEIAVPVTLVWPERDRLIARPSRIPPGVREVTLPGCGHVPMWDDPRRVAEAILEGSTPPDEGGMLAG